MRIALKVTIWVALGGIAILAFVALVLRGLGTSWTGFGEKSLWDWMELLIVPIVLGTGLYFLNYTERRRQEQRQQELRESEQRAEQARGESAQRTEQAAALQSYLDSMQYLMFDQKLAQSVPNDFVRMAARGRTLTVVGNLDGQLKGSIIQFLYESKLIGSVVHSYGEDDKDMLMSATSSNGSNIHPPIISLAGADLNQAVLSGLNLPGANLSGVLMPFAQLQNAVLANTNLSGAILDDAVLTGADLGGANLTNASLEGADLTSVNLVGANLTGANLVGADLTGVELTDEQTDSAAFI